MTTYQQLLNEYVTDMKRMIDTFNQDRSAVTIDLMITDFIVDLEIRRNGKILRKWVETGQDSEEACRHMVRKLMMMVFESALDPRYA